MEFKINNPKRPLTSIPYVRSSDGANEINKANRCFGFLFRHKTSLLTMLFFIAIIVCFIMMTIYLNFESEDTFLKKRVEPMTIESFLYEKAKEKSAPSSKLEFEIDPQFKKAILAFTDDEKIIWPDLNLLTQNDPEMNRLKRQIPQNSPDCRSRQSECKIILAGVRSITKAVQEKLDELREDWVERGILSETDPKDVKFRKIVECLQCRNTINPMDEGGNNMNFLPGGSSRQDRLIDFLPYFENHPEEDDDGVYYSKEDSSERSDRIPKTPYVVQSVTNNSKVAPNGAKITEILHNTTIVEDDPLEEVNNRRIDPNLFSFFQGPIQVPEGMQESQVTRNMDATSFILPTAETTKTSQQIQFAPQNSWPSVPVCFYGPPSSSNLYQFKQSPSPGSPFFQPFGQSQGGTLNMQNQPSNYYINGQTQPLLSPNYMPMMPAPQPTGSPQSPSTFSPQQQQPFAPPGQRLYCTYLPAPTNYQLPQQPQQPQPFPFIPNSPEFPASYMVGAKNSEVEGEPKSTYDESDEKYWVSECPGFRCNPPYRKCIGLHERCDGKVDCMNAEDESDCPHLGYYSRLLDSHFNLMQPPPQQHQPSPSISQPVSHPNAESEWPKTVVRNFNENGARNFGAVTFTVPATNTPPLPPPSPSPTMPSIPPIMITLPPEIEHTTFTIVMPEIPMLFSCRRVIQTIPIEKRCDGEYDCEDATDEEDCTCKDYLQRKHPYAICDGHVDCYDGTDEKECNFCKENEYHCHRSGGCIPKEKRCDHVTDCHLHEDELDCFALTDGRQILLDQDRRPILNPSGLLTRYDNGVWRPSCFKPAFQSDQKQIQNAGQKICEYLGFKNVDYAGNTTVQTSKLVERHIQLDLPMNFELSPRPSSSKRETNKTCDGLYVSCKRILGKNVNVHLKIDPKTKEKRYQWPWEASIFVDGKYHCSAVILEDRLLLSSSNCSDNIDLRKNYTMALAGVPSPDLPFNSPYEQGSPITDVTPIKNSDASLFRLKDPVNMTHDVQPLYQEKVIFPASNDDICVALGVNDKHERKMKFLQPVLDCPKCHRCYVEKADTANCSRSDTSGNWHGNVVCLNNGGWYPAAVFQDKDEDCGFVTKQILNSIDYIHAHLSPAIEEGREAVEQPFCEGVRCSLGQCISWEGVCNGARDCRDGADESPEYCKKMHERCENDVLDCKCSKSELRCGDGQCISKEKFCDGTIDCKDRSDEPASCTCGDYLRLTNPKQICDGRRHCLDKSDENYKECLCKDASFNCKKSIYNETTPCIPQDFVCDGERDCPEGEDEAEDVCWVIKSDKKNPKGKGEVMRRSFGVLHSECFPRPVQTQREVTNICAKLGYTSGLLIDGTKISDSIYVPRNDFYMFQLNNYTWMTLRSDKSFGVWIKPDSPCYKAFVHCF